MRLGIIAVSAFFAASALCTIANHLEALTKTLRAMPQACAPKAAA